MAARKNKTTLTDDWKKRIQASQIMNRLKEHFDGNIELTRTQIDVGKIILSKMVPDLTRTTLEGDPDKPLQNKITIEVVK